MAIGSGLVKNILKQIGSTRVLRSELIQELWSGYGTLSRLHLDGAKVASIIVKHFKVPTSIIHPREWNTEVGHARKLKSYEVEAEWYRNYARLCSNKCKVPKCLGMETKEHESILVLEDLNDLGFTERRMSLDLEGLKVALTWLAHFHAKFMNDKAKGLWPTGTYWHLATRGAEFEAMPSSWLKENASKIGTLLNEVKYTSLVHGDAKLANFCFTKNVEACAAIDFQYVGKGCGIKDVAYLLGSCWDNEQLFIHEEAALNHYFSKLEEALKEEKQNLDFKGLEIEWRKLFPIAWADFTRFLLGWSPGHHKINDYSMKQIERAKELLG